MQKFFRNTTIVQAIQFTREDMNRVFNDIKGNRSAEWDGDEPILRVMAGKNETVEARDGDWLVLIDEINGYYNVYRNDLFRIYFTEYHEKGLTERHGV